ncbi:N-acetyltransferase [Bacillus cereus]|uniref:GNAT family N-acetyltransferase n=1 Tax=Bacillus arachidis TaxID=2819290 RepID=A0ABS3NVB3_9BACI|nr:MULTISPECIES: GNAT family N-acetyltransferase [Bacillus]PGY04383.1 N-acetyltransferase [Bacillus cereus]MBO1624708.1 GNAT family N-acetyltransferase [Bacillus arachidis]PFE05750.1 N-acetyltransferase [Bacillus sp. AFS023182]WIY60106.1 GNAT family N-acetyltransferase [Bacillus arachidis]SDY47183.1 riboflavin biosynthesis RibT protein [Bacillus sp. 166amftsu]
MLIRFKKSYEKIAMGLLSFMPTEKDVKTLQVTMKEYDKNDHWQLYLWKQNDDFVGIIGVIKEEDVLKIQHISVNPSHRHMGIGTKMVQELKNKFQDAMICGNEQTASFCEKCQEVEQNIHS